MADLIDRQAAIDALCNDLCGGNHDCRFYPDCDNLKPIQALPSADAVEVVRCKDCANCEHDTIFHQYWCGANEVVPDGFCNYGERKEEINGRMHD